MCPGGGTTTITGTVFAPTPVKYGAADPLYNVLVYIPNGTVQPFPPGISCEQCGTASGSPLVSVLSGPDGKFMMKNVPAGDDIPLVLQIGRWRRQVKIPKVMPCVNNELPAELTRLPRNKAEGDIPLTAILTGNADGLECVLRKIGVDDTEFTLPTESGRIHIYQANGANLGPTTPKLNDLTTSPSTLAKYDMAIFECEGKRIEKELINKQNAAAYVDAGGRLFLTHFSYTWVYDLPPFSTLATWTPTAGNPTQMNAPLTGIVDETFPKGMAFAQWLDVVKAAAPMHGQIQIGTPRHSLDVVNPPGRQWVTTATPATIQQFTVNTPVMAAQDKQCGRLLFSDFHVNDIPNVSVAFPTECNENPMTPQEKVLEFMLFDLASCVQPDAEPPRVFMPPPVAPPPPPPDVN
jgi:hypothetical protein